MTAKKLKHQRRRGPTSHPKKEEARPVTVNYVSELLELRHRLRQMPARLFTVREIEGINSMGGGAGAHGVLTTHGRLTLLRRYLENALRRREAGWGIILGAPGAREAAKGAEAPPGGPEESKRPRVKVKPCWRCKSMGLSASCVLCMGTGKIWVR